MKFFMALLPGVFVLIAFIPCMPIPTGVPAIPAPAPPAIGFPAIGFPAIGENIFPTASGGVLLGPLFGGAGFLRLLLENSGPLDHSVSDWPECARPHGDGEHHAGKDGAGEAAKDREEAYLARVRPPEGRANEPAVP